MNKQCIPSKFTILILTKNTNIEIGTNFRHHSYNLQRTDVWAHLQIYELKKERERSWPIYLIQIM